MRDSERERERSEAAAVEKKQWAVAGDRFKRARVHRPIKAAESMVI